MTDYTNFAGGDADEIVIDTLPSEVNPLGSVEILSLRWEERSRPRRRCVTNAGTRLVIILPRGTVLSHGMLIYVSAEQSIRVEAAAEDVIVIKPSDIAEMCMIAHHLGNWHRSIQLDCDHAILVEPDQPLLNWLSQRNIAHSQEQRPFHPNLKGALHETVSLL